MDICLGYRFVGVTCDASGTRRRHLWFLSSWFNFAVLMLSSWLQFAVSHRVLRYYACMHLSIIPAYADDGCGCPLDKVIFLSNLGSC